MWKQNINEEENKIKYKFEFKYSSCQYNRRTLKKCYFLYL